MKTRAPARKGRGFLFSQGDTSRRVPPSPRLACGKQAAAGRPRSQGPAFAKASLGSAPSDSGRGKPNGHECVSCRSSASVLPSGRGRWAERGVCRSGRPFLNGVQQASMHGKREEPFGKLWAISGVRKLWFSERTFGAKKPPPIKNVRKNRKNRRH